MPIQGGAAFLVGREGSYTDPLRILVLGGVKPPLRLLRKVL